MARDAVKVCILHEDYTPFLILWVFLLHREQKWPLCSLVIAGSPYAVVHSSHMEGNIPVMQTEV